MESGTEKFAFLVNLYIFIDKIYQNGQIVIESLGYMMFWYNFTIFYILELFLCFYVNNNGVILLSFLWKDPYISHCLICSTDTILKLDIYVEYHVSIMIAQNFANFFNIHWKYDVIKKYDVIDTIICWGQHFETYYISNESTLQDKSFDVYYNEIGPQTTEIITFYCFFVWPASKYGHL